MSAAETYRRCRRAGWAPTDAIRFARLDETLRLAERLDGFDFRWEDELWEDGGADEEIERDIIDGLNADRYRCESCTVVETITDTRLGRTFQEPTSSLHQIVTGFADNDKLYRRLIEIELAIDAEIIGPMPHPFVRP